ncbi:hypothetical protein Nepgr_013194 [Nepenthes gracilis]|uniref:Uncharacterized protein n=1 Tax=Nepenthes gracilis TaxID=150966 RepID=A0AAD3XNS2_NEPGR|nr:hypothetical protein Nepgr_013194 [Nepenthes gracilis]
MQSCTMRVKKTIHLFLSGSVARALSLLLSLSSTLRYASSASLQVCLLSSRPTPLYKGSLGNLKDEAVSCYGMSDTARISSLACQHRGL